MKNKVFDLIDRVAIITGGAGLFGEKHAEAIAEAGGTPILVDINKALTEQKAKKISDRFGIPCLGWRADITDKAQVQELLQAVIQKFSRVDILINNAANNPKQEASTKETWSRLENFTLDLWQQDLAVGLTGAFICSQVIGTEMARRGGGVILNIASDLGIIAPDQRIYRKPGLPEEEQSVKPVSYSVVKHGLIGLTKYLATYWADKGVRVNAISPGGIYNNQPADFVEKLTNLIPMSRMADRDEYKGAIIFLVSDASAYMTGSNLIIDGGRTCW